MMIHKKILLLVVGCFAVAFCIAQQIKNENRADQYRAVHWGLDEGLSQAETYYMIKDIKGFLWIGTKNGLNRFDGNSFKIYFHDDHKKGTIANDFTIYGMTEDSLHNIWIGTNAGVSRYDVRADTFTNISSVSSMVEIVPFQADKNEVYCWEAGNQITSYNIHSLARKKLAQYDDKDEAGNGVSRSYSYVDTNSNSIWMLTGTFGVPGGGLLQVSLKDGKKQHYEFDCPRHIPGHSHGAEAMCYDRKRNSIWLNTNDGLIEFTLADKQFHPVNAFEDLIKMKGYDRFVGVALDKKGRVWLASNPEGILIYDPSDLSLKKPFPSDSLTQLEVSDANACLYIDKDDIIWAGSWLRKGIHQIIPYSQVVKRYTPDAKQPNSLRSNTLFTIVPAGRGKIWIGTQNGGINILDKQTGLISAITEKDLPGVQMTPFITPVMIDTTSQTAWLAATNNFFKTDLVTKKSDPVTYKNQDGRQIPGITGFLASCYNKHDIIINASYSNQQGIFMVNKVTNVAQQVLSFPGSPFDPFFTILAGNHTLFLRGVTDSTGNHTYTVINGKWVSVPTPIDSIRWSDLKYNEMDSTYWVAGERQLFHFGKDYHLLHRYTIENGLPEFIVTGLMPDKKGNIWFHTDRSIHQLNIETGVITILTDKDGFEKQDFSNFPLVEIDTDGTIYFTGGIFGNGFNQVNPGNFISAPSSIYIQSIEVNQKPLPLAHGRQ